MLRSLFTFQPALSALAAIFGGMCLFAIPGLCSETVGHREGYIFDVEAERYENLVEVSLPLNPDQGPALKDLIFDDELSKEFKTRYEERFGRTSVVRNIEAPKRFDPQLNELGVWVSAREDEEERRRFGEYMVKRLSEHHVDGYVKSNPKARPLYEFKERVSNVKVEVKKGYKMSMRYSFSGNFMTLKLDNPHDIQTIMTLEMNPDAVGPSDIDETRLYLAYPLTKRTRVSSDWFVDKGNISLASSYQLMRDLEASITTSYINQNEDEERDRRFILGLSWSRM